MGLGTLRAVRSTDWDLGCALLGTTGGADFGIAGADFGVAGGVDKGSREEGLAGLNTSFPMLSTSLAMASLGGLCFSLDLSMFAAVLSSGFCINYSCCCGNVFPPILLLRILLETPVIRHVRSSWWSQR